MVLGTIWKTGESSRLKQTRKQMEIERRKLKLMDERERERVEGEKTRKHRREKTGKYVLVFLKTSLPCVK